MVEGQRIKADLQSSLKQLSITQEKYHKAFGASERALDAYHKADADINLSRAEVRDKRMCCLGRAFLKVFLSSSVNSLKNHLFNLLTCL